MDKVQLQTAHQCFTQGMRNKIKSLGLNAYWLRQSVTLLSHHPNQPTSQLPENIESWRYYEQQEIYFKMPSASDQR